MQQQNLRCILQQIHKELWELEGQGEIDACNIKDIMLRLTSALRHCTKAKWLSVQHLRVENPMNTRPKNDARQSS
jgi:hypothetical protein